MPAKRGMGRCGGGGGGDGDDPGDDRFTPLRPRVGVPSARSDCSVQARLNTGDMPVLTSKPQSVVGDVDGTRMVRPGPRGVVPPLAALPPSVPLSAVGERGSGERCWRW